MSVEYFLGPGGERLVRVHCDGCHRSCTSDTLMDDDICRLVGWTFDFGAVWCFLCQWQRGETPAIARRLADQAGSPAGRPADPHAGLA